jgi:ribonuclease HII
VGIDEAGYGPNLGPMVMTAVVAEDSGCGRPASGSGRDLDLWRDLARTVDRAGGDPSRLWVDDSKAILRGGKGRDRLEMACLAAVVAAGNPLPDTLTKLVATLAAGAQAVAAAELSPWFDEPGAADSWPWCHPRSVAEELLVRCPLVPAARTWRLGGVYSAVVGPSQFNAELARTDSKAQVHFAAFSRILRRVWERAADGLPSSVTADKHGGRHYYMEPLSQAFADAWVDRGSEGPELSRYTIREAGRRLELKLIPRADQCDGLVALASMISKTVRELWMDGFNAYWRSRVPGLRPTAGYPEDAQRFRRAIANAASAEGCDPACWWRMK